MMLAQAPALCILLIHHVRCVEDVLSDAARVPGHWALHCGRAIVAFAQRVSPVDGRLTTPGSAIGVAYATEYVDRTWVGTGRGGALAAIALS